MAHVNTAYDKNHEDNEVKKHPQGNSDVVSKVETTVTTPKGKIRGCYKAYTTFLQSVLRTVNSWFEKLATKITEHPYVGITIPLLFVAICCLGVLRYDTESRTEKLYTPENSITEEITKDSKGYFLNFENARRQILLFRSKNGKDLFERECVEEAKEIVHEFMIVKPFEEVCVKKPMWINNFVQYAPNQSCFIYNPYELITNSSNAMQDLNQALKNLTTLTSTGSIPKRVKDIMLSDTATENGQLKNIGISMVMFYLQSLDQDKRVVDWERSYEKKMKELRSNRKCVDLYIFSSSSIDDSVSDSISSDLPLVAATFFLMILFATLMLGNFTSNIEGHSLLAIFGVLSTILGMVAGAALAMMFGTPYTSPIGFLPFLILSIGIDDMFIIVDEFDKLKHMDPVKRIPAAMGRIGATITMTTLTDITAFLISVSSDLKVIRYFCLFATFAFVVGFILQVTLFVAFLTLDARRITSKRRDCLPFCKGSESSCIPRREKTSSYNIMRRYGEILTTWPAKALTLVVTAGLLVFGIYGCFHVSNEFDRTSLVKPGDPLVDFFRQFDKHFGEAVPISVVKVGVTDYTDKRNQEKLIEVPKAAFRTGYYKDIYSSWFEDYVKWAKTNNFTFHKNNFTRGLKIFFQLPLHAHYQSQVIVNEDHEIEANRIMVFRKPAPKSTTKTQAMIKFREELNRHDIDMVPMSYLFIYLEGYAVVVKEIIRNTSISTVAILIVTLPFCVHPLMSFLLLLSFAVMLVDMVGLMYFWGVSLDAIAMMNLVISIGFAVDYTGHVAHTFITSREETTEARIVDALSSIGASVLKGGISTFLGMIVLAFSSSTIFQVMFKMFISFVIFGLFNGLVLLPVLISVVGSCVKMR